MNQPNNFYAGKICSCYNNWLEITSDKWILDTVKNGYHIEFDSDPCHNLQQQITFSDWEKGIICNEVQKLLSKQVIRKVQKHEVKYLSSIFLRPKPDGSFRLILNLKKLNGNIDKIHFKMETLKTLLTYWLPRTATLHPLTSKMPIIVFRCILIAKVGIGTQITTVFDLITHCALKFFKITEKYCVRPNYRSVRLSFSKLLRNIVVKYVSIYTKNHLKKGQQRTYPMKLKEWL